MVPVHCIQIKDDSDTTWLIVLAAVESGRGGNPAPRREQVLGSLLIVALVVASAVLVFDFSSLKSPTLHSPPDVVTVTSGSPTGQLKIAVTLGRPTGLTIPLNSLRLNLSSAYPSITNLTVPIFPALQKLDPVNFSIRSTDSAVPPVLVSVRQPGRVELTRPSDTYLVSTSNEYYNFSVKVSVSPGQVSELNVTVTQGGVVPTFVQFSDPELTGVIYPWQTIVLVAPSLPHIPRPGVNIFLGTPSGFEVIEYNASGPVRISCVSSCHTSGPVFSRATVVNSEKRPDGWLLELRPVEPIPIGTSSLFVYSFQETHEVKTNA
jgi:hypothetical protein